MSGQLRTRYDIVINGGGIVGFTLLNLILKSKHLSRSSVLLIEQASKPAKLGQPDSRNTEGERIFSNRVSSITHTSKSALRRLGVWEAVKPYSKDVKKIKVWNYDYLHKITFKQDLLDCQKQDPIDQDIVFSTLENNRLSMALLDSIHRDPAGHETITWSKKMTNLEESLDNGQVDVTLMDSESGDQSKVSAALVLGCDGFRSKVRDLAAMRYKEFDLKKTAIVGTVKIFNQGLNTENDIAYQRFSAEKETVAALLPLDGEHSSFVISAPNDYAKHLSECDDEVFTNEFNQLLESSEKPANFVLNGVHEFANATYDNLKSLIQIVGPRLGFTNVDLDLGDGFDNAPRIDRLITGSRTMFPLIFGTTSPRMVTSLPGLDRPQIALLGDAAHRIHPLAGQGLNLGIQDAITLVKQLDDLAGRGERVFDNAGLLCKALKKYELKRQAYVIPMSASILAMQDLFKLAPSRLLTSTNKCQIIKSASVRFANGI